MIILGYSRAAPAAGVAVPVLGGSTGLLVPAANGSVQTETVDLAGLGLVEGDLVLVAIVGDNSLAVADGDPVAPDATGDGGVRGGQGYTDIVPKGFTNDCGHHVACKVMGAVPDSSVVINRCGPRGQSVLVQAVRGVDRTAPLDGAPASATGAIGSGMPNPPACATTAANCLRVACGMLDDVLVAPTGAPAGWTGLVHQGGSVSGGAGTVMLAFKEAAAAGPDDPGPFGGTNAGEPWIAFHFALRGRAA